MPVVLLPGVGAGVCVGFVEPPVSLGPPARLVPMTGGLVGLRESSQFAVVSTAKESARRTRHPISLT
jgi:hypothetical protein